MTPRRSSLHLRSLIATFVPLLLLAAPAQAKHKDQAALGSEPEAAASQKPEAPPGRGTGGIPAVLQKLDEIQHRIEQNSEQIARLEAQVQNLDANVTPCTLDRFQNGQCGSDNNPLDLMVSVCGNAGANAGLLLKYAFTSNLDVQAGVGWKDAPDVHIVENAQLPAIIGPVIPIVLPSELAGQVNADVGLGLDGCVGPIRIPIGKQLPRAQIVAILQGLEAQARPVADRLIGQLNGGGGGSTSTAAAAATGPGMGLANLADALSAADSLRDQEISEDNSMAAFGRGPIRDLADSLPVGVRLSSILDDPEQLALPGMGDRAMGARASVAGSSDPGSIVAGVCGGSSSVPASLAPLCDFISTRLPSIQRVLDLVPTIEIIPDLVNDAVDGVRELLEPLFSNAGETASTTLSRFCNSSVGQRRIFDRLCGR